MGSLVLIAGLAWNDAFQSTFNRYFPRGGAILAKFIYALVLTTIVIVIVIVASRVLHQETKFS